MKRDTRYEFNDTIAAVSSATAEKLVIIRLSGPDTLKTLSQISTTIPEKPQAGIYRGCIAVDDDFKIDAVFYLFLAPHSYTGETVAEIYIYSNRAVTESVMAKILAAGARMAGPGEFTARAYLNGKIDLSQAEAVNEIISSSNKYQLAAAEKLLSGKLAQTTEKICEQLMDTLSLIEAEMDFSGEDIEFITSEKAAERLSSIKVQLEQLLSGSISYESLIDLPSVGIAGATNAGKSSLLNSLLGQERSIVSDEHKTTRDVLAGTLDLPHSRSVLFDCAGLIETPSDILDKLAQQRAVESLNHASVVVFCVDISKSEWNEDLAIRGFIKPEIFIPIATKADLVTKNLLKCKITELKALFGAYFLPLSVKSGLGMERLVNIIDEKILEFSFGNRDQEGGQNFFESLQVSGPGLTIRHRQAVTEAIDNITESVAEIKAGNDEMAAMMMRTAYQSLSNIAKENIDEQILENIFGRFCIGK